MNKFQIHLADESQWVRTDGVYARGTVFRDGELLSKNSIADLLRGQINKNQFKSIVESFNGKFSVIVRSGQHTFAAIDRWNTYPIYYGFSSNKFYISDDSHWVYNQVTGGNEINKPAKSEYIKSLSVRGSDTLAPSVKQIQAGELISLVEESPDITKERYYRFGRERRIFNQNKDNLIQKYENVLDEVFQRLIRFADGRPIAISLSGGTDSRLIALKLSEFEYPNLFAFAYTRGGEENVAKDVADSLDIDFEHIPISHQEVHDWYHSDERRNFDRRSGDLAIAPNHWVALGIKKLKDESSIPSDAIIVTGDGAQTMPEHIPQEYIGSKQISRNEFIDRIISDNYFSFKLDFQDDSLSRERIVDVLDTDIYENASTETVENAISAFEEWDWQERQCKAIRSSYLYDYFDYEFWFPFKDHTYMDFWQNTPLEYRSGKSLHDDFVRNLYSKRIQNAVVESSFRTNPKWIWLLNNTIGRLPLFGSLVRHFYRHFFKSSLTYDPQFGMISESQLNEIIDEFVVDDENLAALTARHVHALDLIGLYNIADYEVVI